MVTAPPNFTGAWVAVIDDCVFRMPRPVALRMWIAHQGAQISHRVLTVWADRTERLADVRYVIGGRVETEIGGRAAVVRAAWQGETLVIESEVGPADQRLRLSDHWSISVDGQTLSMAHPDDVLAGQVCVLKRVLEDGTPPQLR
jgi:hypothetical protein